jgi:hypothetical protein
MNKPPAHCKGCAHCAAQVAATTSQWLDHGEIRL